MLLNLPAVRSAKSWFVYVSSGSEVNTHQLIRDLLERGLLVAVPRVISGDEMIAQQIRSFEELHLGLFGFLEPPIGEAHHGGIDVCICPGVAFTERGDRLGSGRGFYDRYLAAHPPRLAIGLAFELQLVAQLPMEAHDRRMDYIVTERQAIQVDRASR